MKKLLIAVNDKAERVPTAARAGIGPSLRPHSGGTWDDLWVVGRAAADWIILAGLAGDVTMPSMVENTPRLIRSGVHMP